MPGKETAMIELTEEQRRELTAPEPAVLDPQTRQVYILVPKEAFDRMKALLAMGDYDPEEGMPLMNEAMAEDDAKDPLLDNYQHHGKRVGARSVNEGRLPR
jgi:hypothetical protein